MYTCIHTHIYTRTFSALTRMWPLQNMERGHSSGRSRHTCNCSRCVAVGSVWFGRWVCVCESSRQPNRLSTHTRTYMYDSCVSSTNHTRKSSQPIHTYTPTHLGVVVERHGEVVGDEILGRHAQVHRVPVLELRPAMSRTFVFMCDAGGLVGGVGGWFGGVG